jgi:uncharacterized protein YbjT (DUF2867 family)
MILVVGATGQVGSDVCRKLAVAGRPVKALVRAHAAAEKVQILKALGATLVEGDLKDPASLDAACRDVQAVISTASATISRQPGDSIQTVDLEGQINLIKAAKRAGVAHFIFTSAHFNPSIQFPLQAAKQQVEQHLRATGITWTVLQPTFFMEVWLSPLLGFDYTAGRVQIYGSGRNEVSYISYHDVASAAVAALGHAKAQNVTIPLGGPRPVNQVRAVRVFEGMLGRSFVKQYIPEEQLRARFEAASDPLEKSMAGLTLLYALGDVIDMRQTADELGIQPTAVRDYAREALGWRRQSTAVPE